MDRRFLFTVASALAAAILSSPALAASRGCADGAHVVVDQESFSALERRADVDRLGVAVGRQFRRVANAMCASGRLPTARMRRVRRLLVDFDVSIMNVQLVAGRAQDGERDMISYAFYFHQEDDRAGVPLPANGISPFRLPRDGELREGLLCWRMGEHMTRDCEERGN